MRWFLEQYPTKALISEIPPVDELEMWHIDLADRMFDIINLGERRGVGLAANQVGAEVRMFVWRIGDANGLVFNPEIIDRSPETAVAMEGCLSLPESFLVGVQRHTSITVRWMNEEGDIIEEVIGDEYKARVWQHEIDHLNGLSIVDTMTSSWKRKKRSKLASIMTERRLLEEELAKEIGGGA